MRNVDYPSDLTCHVRDPKVWKDGDTYYMIQGARTKEDVGQALIFASKDKINWKSEAVWNQRNRLVICGNARITLR